MYADNTMSERTFTPQSAHSPIGHHGTVRDGAVHSGAVHSVARTIENLREISMRCLTGQPLGTDLSRWLGSSLRGFLEHDHRSVDDAMGLKFPQGGVPWWREEAMRKRDTALRTLAERFLPGRSTLAKANHIRTAAVRYAATAWRRDQSERAMPKSYAHTERGYLWLAFHSGAPMPLGVRQLRNILA